LFLSGLILSVYVIAFFISPRIVYSNFKSKFARSEWTNKEIAFVYLDKNRKELRNTDLKGKIVLLDYWFIGCTPCYQKMIELEKIATHYKDNNRVMIITVNSGFKDSFDSFNKASTKFSKNIIHLYDSCLLYTSDAADEEL
jgi:thiol-disulfide isomerase/thioredoxin